ncbi:glycosyltransferase [Erythrobacter sp. HL-111]|uniref:glycosyltransferase n=1 Tax=Erythrobacter sp. HL-111 TaxID=1798193 RepID=UPI0006D95948|nr:glycosyltransferase [Erythrobacter sp. HL-111]KPP96180.1 MAG: Glycosyltransferase [Erythrobacteraceae bacterium HL-111]SDR79148.1 Glycosyltransferase involved in cell wall bisynthesis [Erythrobacter sp. HL-111]
MKIAVIAHIRHPIAEPFMGGMEAHCRMLCDGLRARGHEVTLFAAARSVDEALEPICEAPYEDVLPWSVWRGSAELASYQRAAFARAWERIIAGGFDVVHNNSLHPEIIDWAVRDVMPCVTSQHVPPFGAMREAVARAADLPHLAATLASRSQLDLWEPHVRSRMAVVHNGVACDQWTPAGEPEEHFVWVGRITPTKGTAEAARAAHRAGLPLRIFGPVEDARYFEEEVCPHLSDGVEFHGHVCADRLRSVVARARAALVTPLWDEPFGLVAAEALACGTPVCAFDAGALGEVVGDCGFVVPRGDVESLALSMGRIDRIDRTACRDRALARFSRDAMIEGYEACYRAAIDALLDQAAAAFSSSRASTSALLA